MSSSPSPLAIGPKAFVQMKYEELKKAIQPEEEVKTYKPKRDNLVTGVSAPLLVSPLAGQDHAQQKPCNDAAKCRDEELEIVVPVNLSNEQKTRNSNALDFDVNSRHSVVSAPGTTRCDLDQLMPFSFFGYARATKEMQRNAIAECTTWPFSFPSKQSRKDRRASIVSEKGTRNI